MVVVAVWCSDLDTVGCLLVVRFVWLGSCSGCGARGGRDGCHGKRMCARLERVSVGYAFRGGKEGRWLSPHAVWIHPRAIFPRRFK